MVIDVMPGRSGGAEPSESLPSPVASKHLTLSLASRAHTIALGRRIGISVTGGDVLALIGDLGAGKTTLVRGIASGVGADPHGVSSPTFVLAHEYRGRIPLYHLDLYRLGGAAEAEAIGLSEFFTEGSCAAIEWADRCAAILPADRLEIRLVYRLPSARQISFSALGPRSAALLSRIHDLCRRRRSASRSTKSTASAPRKAARR